jgi:hypothetical protein
MSLLKRKLGGKVSYMIFFLTMEHTSYLISNAICFFVTMFVIYLPNCFPVSTKILPQLYPTVGYAHL